jgi:hypothetical protein
VFAGGFAARKHPTPQSTEMILENVAYMLDSGESASVAQRT